MIAFVLAATLLSNFTPNISVVPDTPKPKVETIKDTTSGPILSSVAVTLECTAHTTGRVSDCHVLGETHPGLGFGDAAIALMQDAEVDAGPRDFQFARTIQFMP